METRLYLVYAVINCVVILQYSESKPFSLNKAIAAEAQQKHDSETISLPKLADSSELSLSLNKALNSNPMRIKKDKKSESIIPLNKKISPLLYRKTFQIKSPLRPKKIKYTPTARQSRKNQSLKREINENDLFNQKYIPLLRSVGLLFDDLLSPDASDSYEESKLHKNKRTRYYSGERSEPECICAVETEHSEKGHKSREETDPTATSPTIEITSIAPIASEIEITPTSTDNTPFGNISSLRQHKDLPVLFSRNSFSRRRNNNGFSEGSGAPHNGSIERDISRANGNSEYISGSGEDRSDTEDDAKYTDGDSRNSAGGDGTRKRLREYRTGARIPKETTRHKVNDTQDETSERQGRDTSKSQRQDQFEMDRDKTESSEPLSEPVRRLQGAASKNQIITSTELSKTVSEGSLLDVSFHNSSNKRISDRGSTLAPKNQEIYPRYETTIANKLLKFSNDSKTIQPVVVIIDGYSVTRGKYGPKKLARKTIQTGSK